MLNDPLHQPDPKEIKKEMEKLRKLNFTNDELHHYTALVLIRANLLLQYKAMLDLENEFLGQLLTKRKKATV